MKESTKAMTIVWLGILGLVASVTSFIIGIYYGWLAVTPGMEERASHLQSVSTIWGWLSGLIFICSVVAIVWGVKVVNRISKHSPDGA